MIVNPLISIKDLDFEFENSPVRIVANRKCPRIELMGLKIGPFEEGGEYEVRFWVARELEKSGIVRFREEMLDAVMLYKIQWKERVQSVRRFSALPEDFYPKLRRYLISLKEESARKTEKLMEYKKVAGLSQDIINCRLKKLVSLSSSPAQTSQILQNLVKEEHIIYDYLFKIISEWRSKIIEGSKS